MRLSDGFYSGAMPQSGQVAQAPAYAGGVDQTNTGSIGAPGGGATYGTNSQLPPPSSDAPYGASASVSRSQLPPPPSSPAAYQPVIPAASANSAAVAPQVRPVAVAAATPAPAAPSTQSAPAQTQQASAPDGRTVTVQAGDSLNAIAKRTGVSVADLRAANGLATDNIRIGQSLTLPAGAGHTRVASLGSPPTTLQAQAAAQPAPANAPEPAQAQTEPKPAAEPGTSVAAPQTSVAEETQTASLQPNAAPAPASTGIDQFRWPVQGRVVKGFGDKVGSRRNDGVDISVPRGTPVKAAENGVVIYAGEGLKEFGKTVLVKHDNGLVTVYGHADDITVERGAKVQRGQEIAKAGMTGDTEVPMLHFEVRKDSSPVDPMTYLN